MGSYVDMVDAAAAAGEVGWGRLVRDARCGDAVQAPCEREEGERHSEL